MLDLPADMLALAAEIPPPEEWIIAKIIMPLGDVWVSDRPVSPALLALLPADPLPMVEDWGTLDDGGGLGKVLSVGISGFLCCPKTRIVLIRADQTKTDVDAIISQGIHNRRVELYRWFGGMTSAPVLIDILFCQDSIELKESSMLFSFDAVGALTSENPYMTDRANGNKNWPYLVGKAEGVTLDLLEDQSSKWTTLLGDQDGNEIDEEYTGLIRLDNATRLNPGQHLVNGEEVILATASAGYMELTARARGGTEAQAHASGSRIFPLGAVFKYGVCAGPIGSLDLLRTSNELDFYDEDGDLDTAEYRDLYSGGNEELHPELNPAQVWFAGRTPWLKKDQDYDVADKVFFGVSAQVSSSIYVKKQNEINKDGGTASIEIPLRAFSSPVGGVNAYQVTQLYLPSNQGAGPTFQASETISEGKFTVEQHHGEWEQGTAYTEFKATGQAADLDEGWMSVGLSDRPTGEEFYNYTGRIAPLVGFVEVFCHHMVIDIEIIRVLKSGLEFPWQQFANVGSTLTSGYPYPNAHFFESPFITNFDPSEDVRFKFLIRVIDKQDNASYAHIRIGGTYDGASSWYNMGLAWEYYKVQPAEWISSTFNKNLFSKGTFISAKARISGVVTNTNNLVTGDVIVYENGIEVYRAAASDGSEIGTEVTLSATSWAQLAFTSVKVELSLTDLSGSITSDTVKFEFSDGIQWLLSYTANNLDGLQINYTDQLYVDAVSTRGANWTPARAFKYLSDDKTNWAVDMLDNTDLGVRHTEFVASGHYLNGLLTSDRYQEAIKEVTRQGFSLPVQSAGKVSLNSYLSWPSVVSITGDLNSILDSDRNYSQSNTPDLIQRLIVDYKKNFSTGLLEGQYELSTGGHIENMDTISLDLVDADTAVQQAAAWLFALKSVQLQIFGFDGNFRLLEMQKGDKVNLPNFLDSDLQEDMIAISAGFQFSQPKNDKPSKLIIKSIKVQS